MTSILRTGVILGIIIIISLITWLAAKTSNASFSNHRLRGAMISMLVLQLIFSIVFLTVPIMQHTIFIVNMVLSVIIISLASAFLKDPLHDKEKRSFGITTIVLYIYILIGQLITEYHIHKFSARAAALPAIDHISDSEPEAFSSPLTHEIIEKEIIEKEILTHLKDSFNPERLLSDPSSTEFTHPNIIEDYKPVSSRVRSKKDQPVSSRIRSKKGSRKPQNK